MPVLDYDARCTNCQREVIVQLHEGLEGNPGYFTSAINFCPHCGNLLQYDVMGLHTDSPPTGLSSPASDPLLNDQQTPASGQGDQPEPTSQEPIPVPVPAPPDPLPVPELRPDWLPAVEDVPAPDDPLWGGNPLWGGGTPDDEQPIMITRGALRTALEHQLDPSTLTGTGPDGAITLSDVLSSFSLG